MTTCFHFISSTDTFSNLYIYKYKLAHNSFRMLPLLGTYRFTIHTRRKWVKDSCSDVKLHNHSLTIHITIS
jgi:hypothetical protein